MSAPTLRTVRDLQLIGRGTARDVYSLSHGYVLKSARNQTGIADNIRESDRYSLAQKMGLADILAPVVEISAGGETLIMVRAETELESSDVWEFLESASPKLRVLGIADCHTQNVGTLDSQPVLIDYAGRIENPSQHSPMSWHCPTFDCPYCDPSFSYLD